MAAEPTRALVVVKTWLVHVLSVNSRKVTLPVGLDPPETVAVSVSVVPRGPPPDAWVEMKSEHFTLKAPPVWRQKGEHYLALLERSHASWRTHSGWRGPLMVGVGWRRNTHNAKAQVGGDTPWLSIPFKGLREAETPYDMPWFLVHELGHNFGYHHGPEMDAGEAAVNELNDRERWKDVDAFGP